MAEEVKLDLTHVIVRSCCPPVRCKPIEEEMRGLFPQCNNSQSSLRENDYLTLNRVEIKNDCGRRIYGI